MAHHATVAIALGQRDSVEGLGQRADLIHLDQEGVGHIGIDTTLQALGVGDKEIIADKLHAITDRLGDVGVAGPVILGQGILDRDHREVVEQALVVGGHPLSRASSALECVGTVLVELGRRDVECECDVLAQGQARRRHCGRDELECRAVVRQVGGEAALIAEAGRVAVLLQHGLECVVNLGALAQCLAEGRSTDRRDHELLDVDAGIGMRTAVEDVHHRDGQHVSVRAAEVTEERKAGRLGSCLGHGERDAEDRVRAEARLVRGAVEIDHRLVDEALVGGVVTDDLGSNLLLDRGDGEQDALSAVTSLAIAALSGLEGAGGGTRGHGSACDGVVVEKDFHLDRGVATGVEDFAGNQGFDSSHGAILGEPTRVPDCRTSDDRATDARTTRSDTEQGAQMPRRRRAVAEHEVMHLSITPVGVQYAQVVRDLGDGLVSDEIGRQLA